MFVNLKLKLYSSNAAEINIKGIPQRLLMGPTI